MANTEKIVVQVVVKGEKDLQRVGKSADKSTKSFGKMAAGIMSSVVAFKKISNVVGSVIKSWKAFEFQMAKVKAITGSNETQFKMLSESAQQLGRTTFFTAQQVAELQTNYGKLGFTTGEILKAQEATLALATATDTDLARAAVVAGAAVRGFGLDASETQRVTDVMAVSFTSSAMDIEKWQTSMTKVAPIAAAAGISIESTAAVMSKLTDTGIEASIAGTSLRNILLKMQDSSSDLSKHLGFTVNSSEDLERALFQLNSEGLSNEEIMGLVDLRQVATFNTMIRGAENVAELTDKFNNANGALNEMVEIIEDNLEGDFKKLTSAIDGLKQEVGEELSPTLRENTQNLTDLTNAATDNADAISEVITKVTSFGLTLANNLTPILLYKRGLEKIMSVFGMDGWREFSDFIGLTTAKDTAGDGGAERVERLNEQLQTTLDLTDSNAEQTKKNITTTETHIRIREKELKLVKDKNIAAGLLDPMGVSGIKTPEQQRLEADLKALEDSLQSRELALDVFEKTAAENKKATDDAADKIADQKAKDVIAADKKKKKEELAQEREAFREFQEVLRNNLQEELNAEKQKLIDGEITQEEYDLRAFEAEQAHLENMKSLNIVYGEDVADINGQILDNDLNRIKKVADAELDAFRQQQNLKQKTLDLAVEAADAIMTVTTQNIDRQLSSEVKLLEERKEAGVISQEEYEEGVEKVQRAAFEKKKKIALLEVIIDTAAAVMKIKAEAAVLLAGIFTAPMAAVALAQIPFVLASGAIQAGVIASQKFANGGLVHGKSHAQGGEKFAVGGRVVELEGGEAVINKRSTAMFSSQLSAMNAAGGGVKFADGGLLNQPSFSQQQFNAIGQNQMMGAMGGSSKVVVVEADITDSQNSVSVIQSEATI